jgi:hypothetical protein
MATVPSTAAHPKYYMQQGPGSPKSSGSVDLVPGSRWRPSLKQVTGPASYGTATSGADPTKKLADLSWLGA